MALKVPVPLEVTQVAPVAVPRHPPLVEVPEGQALPMVVMAEVAAGTQPSSVARPTSSKPVGAAVVVEEGMVVRLAVALVVLVEGPAA